MAPGEVLRWWLRELTEEKKKMGTGRGALVAALGEEEEGRG
jgi:hypothetical protein